MTNTTRLIGDLDVDAFIDDELSDQERAVLKRAIEKDKQLADYVVDRAAAKDCLNSLKGEIYKNDPELSSLISCLMKRHTHGNRG